MKGQLHYKPASSGAVQLPDLAAATSLESVGGKAWNLSRVIAEGFDVPKGFVVPVKMFRDFVKLNRLDKLLAELQVQEAATPVGWSRTASAMTVAVMQGELPNDFASSIESRCELYQNTTTTFAVRSSAVGEDSDNAAFAGLLDTFTNVSTKDVVHHIFRCWASYWSARTLAYEHHQGVALHGLAVIIQQQIRSHASGVLFTRSPRPDQADDMLLECCDGAGEQLVNGSINPERCLIEHTSGKFHWDPHSTDSHLQQIVSEPVLARLYDGGLTLESKLDGPQDIEWTIDLDGTLHWLQARPITNMPATMEFDATAQVSHSVPTHTWSNANINENYPAPVTPLLYSIARRAYYFYFKELGSAFGVSKRRIADVEFELQNLVGVHEGRIYYNLTNIHAVLRQVPFGDWLCDAFNLFVGTGETEAKPRKRTSRLVESTEAAWILLTSSIRLFGAEAGVRRFETRIKQFATENSREHIHSKSDRELVEAVESFRQIRFSYWTDAAVADAASMISYAMWKHIVNKTLGATETSLHNSLLKGLGEVMSGKPVEQLWQLSRQVRRDETLSALFTDTPTEVWQRIEHEAEFATFYDACRSYLDEWGFRCSGELMFTVSSFQDEPVSFIGLLKQYSEIEDDGPEERGRAMSLQRETELAHFLKQLKRPQRCSWPLLIQVPFTRQVLAWTQKSVTQRERARYHQAMLYRRFRDIVLELGRRWEMRGWLRSFDHILMLSMDELLDVAKGQEIFIGTIAQQCSVRRNAFDNCSDRGAPPRRFDLSSDSYWNGESTELESTQAELRGDGVCGGQVTGRAVVLRATTEFDQMREGDILVTQQTDPGWAPILFLARGLVMERGGMLSHGAILAREYGIPTVVNVPDATRRIETGMTLRLDADPGKVEIMDA